MLGRVSRLAAGDLVAESVTAIEMGVTAEMFFGQATHVYRPKKK